MKEKAARGREKKALEIAMANIHFGALENSRGNCDCCLLEFAVEVIELQKVIRPN